MTAPLGFAAAVTQYGDKWRLYSYMDALMLEREVLAHAICASDGEASADESDYMQMHDRMTGKAWMHDEAEELPA